MNDTPMSRELLLVGIETLSCQIASKTVLRRVWKILERTLERERADRIDYPIDFQQERQTLHSYARHLNGEDLRSVIRYIHTLNRA